MPSVWVTSGGFLFSFSTMEEVSGQNLSYLLFCELYFIAVRIPKKCGSYCFHRCMSVHISEGGSPIELTGGEYPLPYQWGRGYPNPFWEKCPMGGTPHQVRTQGLLSSQIRAGVSPVQVPGQDGRYPIPGQDGGTLGSPVQDRMGLPTSQVRVAITLGTNAQIPGKD